MDAPPSNASKVKPKRRWCRFSLRALLILITVLCLWLGPKVHHARQQRAAVEAIASLGGRVYYDHQVTQPPAQGFRSPHKVAAPSAGWLRSTLGDDFLSTVVFVELKGIPNLTNDDLRVLEKLPRIKTLFLCAGDGVSGEGLVHLRGLSDLEDLSLGIQVTDDDLAHLTELKSLRWLFLMGPAPGGYVVRAHSRTKSLFDASDYESRVTRTGIEKLAEALPNCRISY